MISPVPSTHSSPILSLSGLRDAGQRSPAELGWKGQKNWEREFSQVQYQALRKATGVVQGTSGETVNRMTGVEVAATHLDNCQARFMARCVEDPCKLGNIMPVGFGDKNAIDGGLAREGKGRRWEDHEYFI